MRSLPSVLPALLAVAGLCCAPVLAQEAANHMVDLTPASASEAPPPQAAGDEAAPAQDTVRASGPQVELITGGNSDKGAAHVGVMPVLD